MRTTDKRVACEPFKNREVKTTVTKGLATINQKTQLTKLKVIYPSNSGFLPGDFIFLKGECFLNEFAKRVYTHEDGTEFILVPEELVEAYQSNYSEE